MSRVLLDENVSVKLRTLLAEHEVVSVEHQGWKGLTNGHLLAAAEADRFDVFVTADQSIRFQQQVANRSFATIILSSPRWSEIKEAIETIKVAIDKAEAGTV